MPMIVSDKQRIHFALEGEHGPYLLLHHGLFGSHRDWYEWGFVKVLSRDYRLVIPDARGHGRSDKPIESGQYALSQFGSDVIAVLDRLDVRTINFIGYSLGALVGFDLLSRFAGRVRGAVLGGEAPVAGAPMLKEWSALADRLETEGLPAVLEALCREKRLACSVTEFPDDPVHDSAPVMLRAISDWTSNEAEKIQLRSPLALFRGSADPAGERIAQAGSRISGSRMISLSEATSADAMATPENLLKELQEFLRSIRRQPEGQGRSNVQQKSEDVIPEGGQQSQEPLEAEQSVESEYSPEKELSEDESREVGQQSQQPLEVEQSLEPEPFPQEEALDSGQQDSPVPGEYSEHDAGSQIAADPEVESQSESDAASAAGGGEQMQGQDNEDSAMETDSEEPNPSEDSGRDVRDNSEENEPDGDEEETIARDDKTDG